MERIDKEVSENIKELITNIKVLIVELQKYLSSYKFILF